MIAACVSCKKGPTFSGPAPTATITKTNLAGVPDPQIAVGIQLVAAADTGDINFYNKSDLSPAAAQTPPTATSKIFSAAQQLTLNQALQSTYCDPANPGKPVVKDSTGKVTWVSTCVLDIGYDTRPLFDPARKRFWVVAAIRNHVWPCTTDQGGAGGFTGDLTGPDIHDPNQPTIPYCHDWLANQAHRYVGIAITKSGEDLSQGFYTYVPNVDEFQDWPQFTVHDNYLIVNHVGGKASTWVFDANALANGVNAGSALKVQPLLTISPSQFSPTPDGGVIPVNMNGESSGVTYLVGASGNNLVIYGIAAPVGNLSGPPAQMTAATINLGRALGWVPSGAVYQNGNIYLADCSDNPNSCQTSAVHILRIPVSASGNTVVANSSDGAGFLDTQVTSYAVDSNAPVSNYLPALQVTDNGDLVVVYASGQYSQGHPVGAYYSVLYHGQTNLTNAGSLQAAVGPNCVGNQFCAPDPAGSGVIDLGGAALDPSADSSNKRTTVWISHVFANNQKYTAVLGAVKP